MAYSRRRSARTRTAGSRKRSYARTSPARRKSGVRRAGGAARQTLRIVIEQPGTSAVARPGPFQNDPKPTKKAQF